MSDDNLSEREQRLQEQLELSMRMREQFMSIISHELRSPLNGIQSWAHVLESQVDASQPLIRRALAGIRTGVDQQVKVIDDLLDASNLLTGKVSLELQDVAAGTVVQAAMARVSGAADEKHVRLTVLGEHSLVLHGDPMRIAQALAHLLSNAVNACPANGSVTVHICAADREVQLVVSDDGKGLSSEALEQVLDPFRAGGRARRNGGMGLGLSVTRRIAELHRGRLEASSEGEGRGARFSLVLPTGT